MSETTIIEKLARVVCEADIAAPGPDEPIYIKMRAAKAWEARTPMAEAALAALHLTPGQAAGLADGTMVCVPRVSSPRLREVGGAALVYPSVHMGGAPESAKRDAGRIYAAMIAASQDEEAKP